MVSDYIDLLALLVAAAALVLSYFNYRKYAELTTQYNSIAQTQALSDQGNLETQLRNSIFSASKYITELALELEKNPDSKILLKALLMAEENYRNVYEDACSKYIDGKVNKKRFRNMYQKEIKQLVEDNPHKEFYASVQSPYTCTISVYDEWRL